MFPVLRPVEILVAIDEDDGGRIVGEARFARTALKVFGGPSLGELYLLGLHVAPELRSSGIGSRLMKAVEKIGCAGGLLCVVLDVERENARARSLFERCGYRRRGNGELDPVELVFSGPLDQHDATPRPARRSKVMMFRCLDRDRDAGKTVWMPSNA